MAWRVIVGGQTHPIGVRVRVRVIVGGCNRRQGLVVGLPIGVDERGGDQTLRCARESSMGKPSMNQSLIKNEFVIKI